MTDLLNGGDFDFLKEHAKAVSAGGSVAAVTERISALAAIPSPVQEIRDILANTAKRVSIVAHSYFNEATEVQLAQAVKDHAHIKFTNPYHKAVNSRGLTLDAIKSSPGKKTWCLYFGNKIIPVLDLDITEVLGLLQTLETILRTPAENTFRS